MPLILEMTDFHDGRSLQSQMMRKLECPALTRGNMARQAEHAARMLILKGVTLVALDRAELLVDKGHVSRDAISFLRGLCSRAKIGIVVCGRTGTEIFVEALASAMGPPAPFAELEYLPADDKKDLALYGNLLKLMAREVVRSLGEAAPDASWLLSDDATPRFLMASRGSPGMTAFVLKLGLGSALRSNQPTLTCAHFEAAWRNCCLPYAEWGAGYTFNPFARSDAPSLTEIRKALSAERHAVGTVELPRRHKGKGSPLWSQ